MALTKCIECGKEISTQARVCPSCGYPMETDPGVNLVECQYCQKMIKPNLENCPYCSVQQFKLIDKPNVRLSPISSGSKASTSNSKKSKSIGFVQGCLILVVGLFALAGLANFLSSSSSGSHPSISSSPSITPNKNTYSDKQKEDARVLMDAAKANHHIFEEGPHLVVEMKSYVEDKNTLLRFVQRIADADCVLNNGPRNIYFYDPSMKQIAQADTLNGVRLKD
jgi:hypothetical protein